MILVSVVQLHKKVRSYAKIEGTLPGFNIGVSSSVKIAGMCSVVLRKVSLRLSDMGCVHEGDMSRVVCSEGKSSGPSSNVSGCSGGTSSAAGSTVVEGYWLSEPGMLGLLE